MPFDPIQRTRFTTIDPFPRINCSSGKQTHNPSRNFSGVKSPSVAELSRRNLYHISVDLICAASSPPTYSILVWSHVMSIWFCASIRVGTSSRNKSEMDESSRSFIDPRVAITCFSSATVFRIARNFSSDRK